jgi:hypothetical protein
MVRSLALALHASGRARAYPAPPRVENVRGGRYIEITRSSGHATIDHGMLLSERWTHGHGRAGYGEIAGRMPCREYERDKNHPSAWKHQKHQASDVFPTTETRRPYILPSATNPSLKVGSSWAGPVAREQQLRFFSHKKKTTRFFSFKFLLSFFASNILNKYITKTSLHKIFC